MPILSSSVASKIRDTHPLIRTRIPYTPFDEWGYGYLQMYPPDNRAFRYGILRYGDSNGSENSQGGGYEGGYAYLNYDCLADFSDAQNACHISNGSIFSGNFNPSCLVRFKCEHITNYQLWIGFASNINVTIALDADPLGDSSLDPDFGHGFGLYVNDGSNFRIISNNGTQDSNFTSDIDTIDTDIHTLYLESDNANSRWGYSWDLNPSITWVTSKIPTPTQRLTLEMRTNNTEAELKRTRIYDCEAWQRRYPVS